jgi:hypothetical protein
MNRYERSILFERLVALRSRYERLDDAEKTAVMTIADALEWAGRLLADAGETEPASPAHREQSTTA